MLFPEIDALYGVPAPAKWHPEIDTGLHTPDDRHDGRDAVAGCRRTFLPPCAVTSAKG